MSPILLSCISLLYVSCICYLATYLAMCLTQMITIHYVMYCKLQLFFTILCILRNTTSILQPDLTINQSLKFFEVFLTDIFVYRSGFLKRDRNHSPKSHQTTFITWLEDGLISDIHSVQTIPELPMDVRNEHQQGTCPQAICSSNFLM